MPSIEDIKKLLWKSTFLSGEEMERTLKSCEGLPEDALNQVYEVLQDGLKKQDTVFRKIVEEDPGFPRKLEGYMKEQLLSASTEQEQQEQEKASKLFSDVG